MGEHASQTKSLGARAVDAGKWLIKHRRKVLAGALVVLPLVARFVPDFPSDTLVEILRTFLGA